MASLSDRQRVELSLPIHMMLTVLLDRSNHFDVVPAMEARELLLEAGAEPLAGLQPEHQSKLLRRVKRLHREVLTVCGGNNARAVEMGLVAFYLLQLFVDTGILVVGDESNFGRALSYILPTIERELSAGIETLAKQQAANCFSQLQRLGYYLELPDR